MTESKTTNADAQIDSVLNELSIFRTCRLRIGHADRTFTLEDILYEVLQAWCFKKNIPHSLNGSIAANAVKRNILRHIGYGRSTRDARHNGEVRTYCWMS